MKIKTRKYRKSGRSSKSMISQNNNYDNDDTKINETFDDKMLRLIHSLSKIMKNRPSSSRMMKNKSKTNKKRKSKINRLSSKSINMDSIISGKKINKSKIKLYSSKRRKTLSKKRMSKTMMKKERIINQKLSKSSIKSRRSFRKKNQNKILKMMKNNRKKLMKIVGKDVKKQQSSFIEDLSNFYSNEQMTKKQRSISPSLIIKKSNKMMKRKSKYNKSSLPKLSLSQSLSTLGRNYRGQLEMITKTLLPKIFKDIEMSDEKDETIMNGSSSSNISQEEKSLNEKNLIKNKSQIQNLLTKSLSTLKTIKSNDSNNMKIKSKSLSKLSLSKSSLTTFKRNSPKNDTKKSLMENSKSSLLMNNETKNNNRKST